MENQKFDTETSLQVKLITNGFIIVALLVFLFHFSLPFKPADVASYTPLFILLIVTWGYHPQYYTLNEQCIRIKRPFQDIIIPLENIDGITAVSKEDVGYSFRLFACGGLFGHFGLYRSKNLGNFQMQCTNMDSLALIKDKNNKLILISPSDVQGFVQLADRYLR